jgi:hypothetical protein
MELESFVVAVEVLKVVVIVVSIEVTVSYSSIEDSPKMKVSSCEVSYRWLLLGDNKNTVIGIKVTNRANILTMIM